MIDDSALDKISELIDEYRFRWGIEPNMDLALDIPKLTQEKLVAILEYIVNTGDSIIVGYNKLKNKLDKEN